MPSLTLSRQGNSPTSRFRRNPRPPQLRSWGAIFDCRGRLFRGIRERGLPIPTRSDRRLLRFWREQPGLAEPSHRAAHGCPGVKAGRGRGAGTPGTPRAQGVGPRAGGRQGGGTGSALQHTGVLAGSAPAGGPARSASRIRAGGPGTPLGYPAGYAPPRARDRDVMRPPATEQTERWIFSPKGQVSAQTRWSQPRYER